MSDAVDAEESESPDERDFEAYYLLWFRKLCAYAARFFPNRSETARDLAQETMLWSYGRGFTRTGQSHLYRYLYCRAIDILRAEKRRPEVTLDAVGEDEPRAVEDPMPETHERRQALKRCVNSLPERERAIIWLQIYEECSVAEIAEITGEKSGSVGRILSEAKDKIAGCMTGAERKRRDYLWKSD